MTEGHFHVDISIGSRENGANAGEWYDYLTRRAQFAHKHDGPLVFAESGNMPTWATDDPRKFWEAVQQHERANGALYHNAEIALPLDLTPEQQLAAARETVMQLVGDKHPYTFTIHGNKGNPHFDVMFTARTLDGIERSPELFFKRANKKNPERGGCAKVSISERGRDWVVQVRKDWEGICNRHLAAAGSDVRIDHRSYKERGIDKAPGVHLGPSAHRLEKAGKPTWRGNKNREAALRNHQLQEIQSQIYQKEKPNERHPGRHGRSPQQPTHTRSRSAGTTTQRAFERWHDSPGDRPGLRSSRRAGPERMPVLREQGAGTGQQKARDAVLQRAVPRSGGLDRGLHGVSGGGVYAVDRLDRRQLYKARILQQQYQQEIQATLAARLAYVDRKPDRIAITLRGGGTVTDHGDRLLTKSGRDQEILAALALIKAKGWETINLTGSEEFKRRAWLEAVRAGLTVTGYEPTAELRTQFEKEKVMTAQAGAATALIPDSTAEKPVSRWLEPLRAARKKLEAERMAAKQRLENVSKIDITDLHTRIYQEAEKADPEFRKVHAAYAQAVNAPSGGMLSLLSRGKREREIEAAGEALGKAQQALLASPAVRARLAAAQKQNQEHEALTAALTPLQLGIGEIEYWEREIHKGNDPEAEFRQAWMRRKSQPLKRWQELAISPVLEADAAQEQARLQAEADAAELVKKAQHQEQIQREIDAQQKADEIQEQLGKPGLSAEQQDQLEQQQRYYQALADGHDEEEAKERAAKKSDALRQ